MSGRYSTVQQGRVYLAALAALAAVSLPGCMNPIGADKKSPAQAYRQTHDNAIRGGLSADTKAVLHRFEQDTKFYTSPDPTLRLMHERAIETRERGLLFALAELNYVAGERLRRSVKPWENRNCRDYYLAASVYAWFFLFGEADEARPSPFDQRFRGACDIYNYGLGWALVENGNTNSEVTLAINKRHTPFGDVECEFAQGDFPWELSRFEKFVVADHYTVRGLSVRNRKAGLGAPLIAVSKPDKTGLRRAIPATALLRVEGGLTNLANGGLLHCSLQLYSPSSRATFDYDGQRVPLETDSTIAMAYALNQSFVWKLGMAQFLSAEEQIASDIYLTAPYQPGRIPVVFVHGTFSSPAWWAEMFNALASDPLLSQKYQFWYFIYNSGNPLVYSAKKFRESLAAKIKQLDPDGRDPALQQMVVIGHSQGGLLTKLTATSTGDKLLETVLKTNRLGELKVTDAEMALLRQYTCYEPLPFVKRVVFISTPHRGSYAAGNFVRSLARRFVTLPSAVMKRASELSGLTERLNLPPDLKGARTSLDSMSPRNPLLLVLAEIPVADGVTANSIIAVQGNGDFHEGRDGLVAYTSAHVDYAESEFIVRSFHSCQDKPPTIEEVRRILHKHLIANSTNAAAATFNDDSLALDQSALLQHTNNQPAESIK